MLRKGLHRQDMARLEDGMRPQGSSAMPRGAGSTMGWKGRAKIMRITVRPT